MKNSDSDVPTSLENVLLEASRLIHPDVYPNFRAAPKGEDLVHKDYVGRIRKYLDDVYVAMKKYPETYNTEFLTKEWTDEELLDEK